VLFRRAPPTIPSAGSLTPDVFSDSRSELLSGRKTRFNGVREPCIEVASLTDGLGRAIS
jgi:hypothetical protein